MRLEEINEILNLYENYGSREAIARLYELQKIETDKLLDAKLVAYMHETNKNNNSFFYTSDKEQIITNNTGSIIYFNRKMFDFTNINNRKIVVKSSLEVEKEEIQKLLSNIKEKCGHNFTRTNNIDVIDNKVIVVSQKNQGEFNKKEFEIIYKILNRPIVHLSDDAPSLLMQGLDGYAYILGKTK